MSILDNENIELMYARDKNGKAYLLYCNNDTGEVLDTSRIPEDEKGNFIAIDDKLYLKKEEKDVQSI